MIKYCFLILCLFPMLNSFSQKNDDYTSSNKKAIALFEKAIKSYQSRDDAGAKMNLMMALKADETFVEATMLLANIYLDHREYESAIKFYNRAIELNPDFFANNYYHLASAQLKLQQYADAVLNLKTFLGKEKIPGTMRKKGEKLLVTAEFAAEAVLRPVPFEPKNLGANINSGLYEYFPTVTTDEQTIIFTRRVPQKAAVYMTSQGDDEDFFMSKKRNGEWLPAINMGEPVNSAYREGAQCVSPDGQYLYFAGCNWPDGNGLCDLYVAKKTGDKWEKPVNMGFPVNTSKWESQPTLSSDGKTLYFASNRAGGKGEVDIWKTTKQDDGSWSKPENVESLNTEGKDEAPFMHQDDHTLYFSSDGHPGMGGMDLFLAKRKRDGSFDKPVNLGYPINTEEDENTLVVSASGENAYFASDRGEGQGKLDLYVFELHKDARPDKVTYAKGIVYDSKTSQRLGAKFELIDLESEEVIVQSNSDQENGEFFVCLPVNKDYALNVSKQGYLFYSENFSLKEAAITTKIYQLKVPLQPIEMNGTVILKNVFFETAKFDLKPESKAELNKLAAFLTANTTIKIELGGHTDNVGNKQANQTLSENRAKSVLNYLVQKGIESSRLSSKGYGDSMPIADNATEDGRQQNRRTVFKVTGK